MSAAPALAAASAGWHLVWSDEFGGTNLDSRYWTALSGTYGTTNGTIHCNTARPANVRVAGGILRLEAHREAYACPGETDRTRFATTRPWTSATLRSTDSATFAGPGVRFEARVRVQAAAGIWPSFWTTSASYPFGRNGASGELDVFEYFGGAEPGSFQAAAYTQYAPRVRATALHRFPGGVADVDGVWHTVALSWTQDVAGDAGSLALRAEVDGVTYGTMRCGSGTGRFAPPAGYGCPAPFTASNPQRLMLTNYVGGWLGDPDPDGPSSVALDVDYIRVYAQDGVDDAVVRPHPDPVLPDDPGDAGRDDTDTGSTRPVPGLVLAGRAIAVRSGRVVALGPVSVPGASLTAASSTASGQGSWAADARGWITATGDATYFGDLKAVALNRPINAMAPTPTGRGYWMSASDGGVFAFGDAGFFGSTGSIALNRPIVGMAATPSGQGYWLVASDGGIFAFGDAGFFGSTGSMVLNRPIVGMAATPSGQGYWLFASDGGVFCFGDASFHGSLPAAPGFADAGAAGMVAAPSGEGYWIVTTDGRVVGFGQVT